MTLSSTTNTVSATLTGNAAETVTIPYYFLADADLAVYVTDQTTKVITVLTFGTDFSLVGAGVVAGGTLTIITTQTANDTITIDRWVEPKQTSDFQEAGRFPSETVETTFDKLMMIMQQMLGRMGGVTHDPGFTEFMSRLSTNTTKWAAKTSIIDGVVTPVANTDAANKAYVDSQISGSGNMPVPSDPGDDNFVLVASGGGATWQNFRVPSAVAADDERLLEVTGTGAGGFTFADLGRRNYLINGGFTVNQRGGTYTAATAVLNSDDTCLLDRWRLLSDGNDVVDVSQDTASANKATGAYASMKSLVATEDKKWGFIQILEARDAAALIGGTVSLSFDVIGSGIQNVRAAVLAGDQTTADVLTSDVVSLWAVAGTNPTLIANWTFENLPTNLSVTGSVVRKKIEGISIDQSNTKNVAVFIWVDDTDGNAADTLNISNVQLELSATAHAFVPRHVQEELALCQRYYCQSYDEGVFRATSDDDGMENFEAAATVGTTHVPFPVRMRIAPTAITTHSRTGTADEARQIGGSDTTNLVVQTAGNGLGDRGVSIKYGTTDAATDNQSHGYHWTADAEL